MVVILSGAWPAYRLGRNYLTGARLALYPALFWVCFYGVQATLDFDFHTDGLAAAFFIWAIWQWESGRPGRYLLCLGLALLCKETIPVYLSFWAVYMLITGRGRRLHLALAVGGLVLFGVELNLILPWLAGRPYYYTDYGRLGQSMGEVVINSINHPDWLAQAFFGDGTKLISWLAFGIASGGALLIEPGLLLMLIPNVIERFLNPQPPRWGLYFHYSVILTPFLSLAVVLALRSYERYQGRWRPSKRGLAVWLGTVLVINSLLLSNFWRHGLENLQHLDQRDTWIALGQLPLDASVVASSRLVPHLAHRVSVDELLSPELPHPALRADYVIISLAVERDPTEQTRLTSEVARWQADPNYRLIYRGEGVFLFRRQNVYNQPGNLAG